MNHHTRTARHGRTTRRDTWTRTGSGRTIWHRGRRCQVAPHAWIA
jgi:hypothetical protein